MSADNLNNETDDEMWARRKALLSDQPKDLRTRIAAVLDSFPADMRPVAIVNLEKADAVIRELDLQVNLAKRIINGKPDQWVRRLVTDWEIVDE